MSRSVRCSAIRRDVVALDPVTSLTVQLRTSLPGPRSKALMERRISSIPKGVANVAPIFVTKAENATLTDVDGNVLLDFAGGIGTLNVGSAHPEVVAAVQQQAEQFLHTCFHVAMYEPYLMLAEELIRITPGTFAKQALLVNSGAEAVENAIKIARRATGRQAVVTFQHAFHGRTLLGLSLTAKSSSYKDGFGPFVPEVYRAPFPNPFHSGVSAEQASAAALEQFKRLVVEEIGAARLAAVIMEPVQGEGGFHVAPPDFIRGIQEFCTQHGVVFIADEIQTGFCRTGRWWACEHYGIAPDLLLTAKSMGGGMPIAAVVGRKELFDSVQEGGLGGTYGGNPVACAAALAVIKVMERNDYVTKAEAIGLQVSERFAAFQERFDIVGEVRGIGAMQAFELVQPGTRAPGTEEAKAVFRYCLEHGLILMKAGHYNNVVRFLAPLTITPEQVQEGLDILERALEAASSQTRG